MADKLAFGEIKKRLVELWKEQGKDKSYKEVSALYKSKYKSTPSDQTIGNARKTAFNLETKKRNKGPAGPTLDNLEGVMNLLFKYGKTAEEVSLLVQQTPVNPFQVFDDAAGSRENLVEILNRLARAQKSSDLLQNN